MRCSSCKSYISRSKCFLPREGQEFKSFNPAHNCYAPPKPLQEVVSRVSHLQFFWILLLFQAGMSACHTQEHKIYKSSILYVGIFQLFLTFVSYKHCLVAKKRGFLLNWSIIVQNYDGSDVVTQYIYVRSILTPFC